MQDATEKCQYPELGGGPMTLVLISTFPPKQVSGVSVLRERMSLVAVYLFRVVGKISKVDTFSLQKEFNCIPKLKFRYFGSFLFDNVQLLTSTIIVLSTQNTVICRVSIGL